MSNKRAASSSAAADKPKKPKTAPVLGPDIIRPPFKPAGFHMARARLLSSRDKCPDGFADEGDCVVYWMSRDQRLHDNHAVLYAQALAAEKSVPLRIVFNLHTTPNHDWGTLRAYGFMLRGLREVEADCRALNIPFYLVTGDVTTSVPAFVRAHGALACVTDFSPLRHSLAHATAVADALDGGSQHCPVVQVDAHNVVPVWHASEKLEYAARTIRPKINAKLPTFLKPYAVVQSNPPDSLSACPAVDWKAARKLLNIDMSVPEVTWAAPGTKAGMAAWDDFLTSGRIKLFADKRNDPNVHACSGLSPYFHYGHISVQRVVVDLKQRKVMGASADSFIEEAVVRKELSDNFCYYNKQYDSIDGCSDWAKESLALHASDPREHIYSRDQFAKAQTHDDLWNAAQLQLRLDGKMHGFLRMYWAKKILEWTADPHTALETALFLNDRYSLDGRDPNGFVGCMWSIGGIHDMGWAERPIFGKIRYMNYAGCKRKFDLNIFVQRMNGQKAAAKREMERKAAEKAAKK